MHPEFNSVPVSFDSIEWAHHSGLDPEFLYQKSEIAPAHIKAD